MLRKTLYRMLMPAILHDPALARAIFENSGWSVAEWARLQGFSTGLVYQVLEGRRKCLRGQSYRIAVALGLKQGEMVDLSQLTEKLKACSNAGTSITKGENASP
jgi:gp16 family phage-associated protein